MGVPNIALDGGQAYGSRVANINGVAYKAESIKIQRPVKEADDQGTSGLPGRKRVTTDVAKISATLQLATSGTVRPQFAMQWTDTFDSAYGAETFDLYPVEYDESNQPTDIRKVAVTGWKDINGSLTTA